MQKKVCVIIGVGPGNGAAFASRFAKAGYQLALLARTTDFSKQLVASFDHAKVYGCDVKDSDAITQTFQQIQKDLGAIDVVVYNAGSGSWGNIEQISAADFESSWRVNTLGLLQVSQQVIPEMKKRGNGSIMIIGATASKRGGINTAAFAPAKAAQRSLAESMAKYLGPLGIHVGLIMIDGVVDLPETRKRMADKSDDFFVKPADVAETVFYLTQQPASAWTFEVEVRPFGEKW